MTDAAPLRLRVIRLNIRERLRAVCAGWPEDQFEAMVTDIATTSLKYEGVATPASQEETTVFRFIKQMNDAVAHVEDKGPDEK
jgi:hypothetical protein